MSLTNKELDKWLAEFMGWKEMSVVSPIHGPWMADRLMENWYVDVNTDPNLSAHNRSEFSEIVKKYYKQRVKTWQPTENISQAFECLYAFINGQGASGNYYSYSIEGCSLISSVQSGVRVYLIKSVYPPSHYFKKNDIDNIICGYAIEISEAICQAIYKALNPEDE